MDDLILVKNTLLPNNLPLWKNMNGMEYYFNQIEPKQSIFFTFYPIIIFLPIPFTQKSPVFEEYVVELTKSNQTWKNG